MMSNNASLIFEMYTMKAAQQVEKTMSPGGLLTHFTAPEAAIRAMSALGMPTLFTFQSVRALVPVAPVSRSHLGEFRL